MLIEPFVAEDPELQAEEAEQAGQGDDEARHAEPGEEEAVEQRRSTAPAPRMATITREPERPAVAGRSRRRGWPRRAPLTEPTDRSISPSSSTRTMPIEMVPTPAHCRVEVDQVVRADRKCRVEDLEDDPDDDEADDDRAASRGRRRARGDRRRARRRRRPASRMSRSSCMSAGSVAGSRRPWSGCRASCFRAPFGATSSAVHELAAARSARRRCRSRR